MKKENQDKPKVEIQCLFREGGLEVEEILKHSFVLFVKKEIMKCQYDET